MQITVTFDLSEEQARLISSWASVGRTIDGATGVLLEASAEDGVIDKQKAGYVYDELVELKLVLDMLHREVRTVLWGLQKNHIKGDS